MLVNSLNIVEIKKKLSSVLLLFTMLFSVFLPLIKHIQIEPVVGEGKKNKIKTASGKVQNK